LHGDDIGTGPRLRHRERSNMLAAAQFRQVLLALRVRAVQTELIHAQVGMGPVGEADRARGARDFLHDGGVSQIAQARATPALRHGDTQQPLLSERRPQVARKLVAAVYLGGARRDPLGGEAPHLGADLLEALIEPEITVYGSHELAFPLSTIV